MEQTQLLKEAMFYEQLDGKKVQCQLCAHNCTIGEGKTGVCNVRKNISGKLYSLIYGKASSISATSQCRSTRIISRSCAGSAWMRNSV